MMLAAASSVNPSYIPKTWHTYLVCILLMLVQAVIASLPTKSIGRFNGFSTYLNVSTLTTTSFSESEA